MLPNDIEIKKMPLETPYIRDTAPLVSAVSI